tara:strand:- start:211 stop:381 length:171 start_codon:yes stop_codon:yes gene_type:complete
MDITSVTSYKDEDGNVEILFVVIDGKTYGVPIEPENRYYVAVQEWVKAGNTIQEGS